MNQIRFSPKLVGGIILALFFGVALYIRIVLPYGQIFSGDVIKFASFDAYYHMRLVDNLIYNFPHRITFDPYIFFPYGSTWPSMPLWDWLIAGVAWLVGLGSPTQHTVDVVGAYFPPIAGALTLIPVYFIGKELFNRWVGVIAAGLICFFPGSVARSVLGFTDHHVAEVLFTTITMLFLILTIKTARQRQLSFRHLKDRDWAVITKPLIYSLLAGIFLGIYLLTWVGGPLFIFIIFVYFIIQSIIDHLRGESTDYLCPVGTITIFVALIMFLPVSQARLPLASLVIALLTPAVLNAVSRLMTSRRLKPAYYPLTLVGLGLAGLAIFQVSNPSLLEAILGRFNIFVPGGYLLTVIESQPLLFPGGDFSFEIPWALFNTGFFLSFISLGILIYLIIKRNRLDWTPFIVWSLIILAATVGQRRFADYFAINVALLTGYLSWLILEFAGFKKLAVKPVETPKMVKKKAKPVKSRKGFSITTTHVTVALGLIVVFFLVFFPSIGPAVGTASQAPFAPDDAWYESLFWLKGNTPDPFGNPDFYYELYEPPPLGESYQYPETAYGVMAWWDYGHWITRIAHRLPNHGPGGGWSDDVARFFVAQDEAPSHEIINRLGSRYIIIDHTTVTTKFYAAAIFAGSSKENFYEAYYQVQEGELAYFALFYPEYYRSLAVRLYNFDGSQVSPQSTMVISYEEKVSRDGKLYKEITGARSFSTYEEAEAFVSSQESGNYRIVGTNPFISPVPLEALEHYQLVYSSEGSVTPQNVSPIPKVKIFEYIGD